jgi:pyrimidine operon attenuation protein/uracil phosphoribosyltransferase
MKRNKILDNEQIKRKLERMARQILEDHYNEKEVVLLGIKKKGMEVAKRLERILNSIDKLKVNFESIELKKDSPLSNSIKCSYDEGSINGKVVIVVDDVLNSGRTMIYAVKHVLDSEPKGVYTAILVDRIHRSFPLRADYCGLSLSTHVDQHISVALNSKTEGKDSVYLEL